MPLDLRIFRSHRSQELRLYLTITRQWKGISECPYEAWAIIMGGAPVEELELEEVDEPALNILPKQSYQS